MRRDLRDLCEKFPVVIGKGVFRRGYEPTIDKTQPCQTCGRALGEGGFACPECTPTYRYSVVPSRFFRGFWIAVALEAVAAAAILIAARYLGWF